MGGANPIHDAAARGFARAGQDYERGRPGYPDAAISLLATELGIGPGRVVLDLAAGTGKLTRSLTRFGARLIAVEPVAEMRAFLSDALPGVEALEGTAEAIPRPDSSVEVVLVAQAFHWFDAPAAGAEIERVLVPGGGLGVLRNVWDESAEWVARLQRVVHAHVGQVPQQGRSRWRAELAASELFTQFSERSFRHLVTGDLDALLARVASVSYIAALDEPARSRVLEEVRAIVAEDPATRGRAELAMPYTTHVDWCWSRRAE